MIAYVHKFEAAIGTMKRRPYDWLDQQQAQFDTDFEEYKQQIADIQVGLCKTESEKKRL